MKKVNIFNKYAEIKINEIYLNLFRFLLDILKINNKEKLDKSKEIVI